MEVGILPKNYNLYKTLHQEMREIRPEEALNINTEFPYSKPLSLNRKMCEPANERISYLIYSLNYIC